MVYQLRRPRAAGAVAMPLDVQLSCYRGDRQTRTFHRLTSELSHTFNDGTLGGHMAVRLHPFYPRAPRPLTLASGSELQHQNVLLELRDCAKDLPD